jgi:phosphoribosylformylglycinamidine cyclo-ligase
VTVSNYAEAGVDLEATAKVVALIGDLTRSATRPEVVGGIGGFAGLFRISEGKLLACATDGVGTKTEIARMAGRLDTVGIELVAMCADDVACTGAEPLLFLDYIALGKVIPEEIAALVEGVAEGCRRAGCALLGGETAEHPGVMEPGRFDLAGFCVGVVEEDRVLGPHRVQEGDVLIGLASTGLHSNGYSLVRRVLLDSGAFNLDDSPPELGGRTVGEELLEPTAVYAPVVLELGRQGLVSAAAHVTGGGIAENLARVLPEELGGDIDRGSWARPAVFGLIQRAGDLAEEPMQEAFNLGLGMVLVVPDRSVQDALQIASRSGHDPHVVGRVGRPGGVRMDTLGSS